MHKVLDKLLQLKEKKQEKLKHLLYLTVKQKEVIAEENLEELQKCLDNKQKFMDEIDKIDADYFSHRQRLKDDYNIKWSEEINEEIYPQKNKIDKLNIEVSRLLREIYDLDLRNKNSGQNMLLRFKLRLGKVRQGKKAYQAYNPKLNNSMYVNGVR